MRQRVGVLCVKLTVPHVTKPGAQSPLLSRRPAASFFWTRLCTAGTIALLVFCFAGALRAQSTNAALTGLVTDSSHALIPGAAITVVNTATNVRYKSLSDGTGSYYVGNLPPGPYRIQIEKVGFKTVIKQEIVLHVQDTININFEMALGSLSEIVTVTGGAPLLQTTNAKISTTITNMMVEELPVVVGGAMRSPFDLAVLTPEATNYGTSVALGGAPSGLVPVYDSFSIGGGQPRTYGITLDGVSMGVGNPLPNSWVSYNTPPLDAITEFTVNTNGYDAQHGHAAGGNMSFVSKSGTSAFHGSAFDYLRNNALDANFFFSNRQGIPRRVYKQNDFGVSAGGPVYIPKVYNGKDKTFFFAAYEGFRNRVGANALARTIPTPEMLTGDFSNWVNSSGNMIPIYDPATLTTDSSGNLVRSPFPGNQIPQNRFDPLAVKLIQVYQSGPSGPLLPNNGAVPGTVGYVQDNFLVTKGTLVSPWDKFSLRIDHAISDNDKLSFFYGRNRETNMPGPGGPATLPGYFSNFQTQRNRSDVGRVSWNHIFSPTFMNYFYAGGQYWSQEAKDANEVQGNWKDTFCLPNVPDCNINLTTVLFGSDGYNQWGSFSRNGSRNPLYSINDDLTWVHGRHTVKFGGMFQKNHYDGFGTAGISGGVGFSPTATGVPGITNFATGGGNSIASFLLGLADNGRIDTNRYLDQQYRYYSTFVQDDIRLTTRLTLNLGLRWEMTQAPFERLDRYSDFSPTTPNPAAGNNLGGLVFAGTGPGRIGRRGIAESNYRSFGPRIGLAYNLNNKTVIRTSYSRSFGFTTAAAGSAHFQGAFQVFTPANTTSGVQPTFLFKDGFPPYPLPPFIDPSFGNNNVVQWWNGKAATTLPSADTWTFSLQRQLSETATLNFTYSGVKGTRLQSGLLNVNQTPFSAFQTYGRALLNSNINSPAAVAAGIQVPYPGFNGSVAQALRPYPQFLTIDTAGGGGDHTGNSTYNAAIVEFQKRSASGLTVQSSYVLSKTLSDTDTPSTYRAAMDHGNRRLDKSLSGFDITHNFKLAWIYELPFGRGKRFVTGGVGSAVLGGWRVAAIQIYQSGLPVGLTTTTSLPLFAGPNRPTISTYDGWGCSQISNFDPSVDTFFQPAAFFGPQPDNTFGNATRYNPQCRQFPNFNENVSVSRRFKITERVNLDFRMEAFNALNRVRFGTGPTSLQNQNFGRLTSNNDIYNTPRQVQLGLKLNW